jgi:hypothetical protein
MKILLKTLLLISFIAILFTEQRTISYHLGGVRTISLGDIFFLMIGFLFFLKTVRTKGTHFIIKNFFLLKYFWLSFLLWFLSLYLTPQVGGGLISPYQLFGLGCFMFFSFNMMSEFPENESVRFVFNYALLSSVLFFIAYLLMRVKSYPLFMYGEGTPAMRFFFNSPNQFGYIGTIILLIGTGAIIVLKRSRFLYFFVPVMILSVVQTGSRSVFCLMVIGWLIFLIFSFLQKNKKIVLHLILSTLLSVMILCLTPDVVNLRGISFLSKIYQNRNTSKKAIEILALDDKWRQQEWGEAVVKRLSNSPKVSDQRKMPVVSQVSLHNVYLDFFCYSNLFSFLLFIIFLFSMVIPLLRIARKNTDSKNHLFYAAICLSFFIILGAFYSNPVLELRYIWVFFGFAMAIVFVHDSKEAANDDV